MSARPWLFEIYLDLPNIGRRAVCRVSWRARWRWLAHLRVLLEARRQQPKQFRRYLTVKPRGWANSENYRRRWVAEWRNR